MERREREPKESFNPRKCIEGSLNRKEPMRFASVNWSHPIERDLFEDYQKDPTTSNWFYSPKFEDRVQEHVTALKERNNSTSLTSQDLDEIVEETKQNKREVGYEIRDMGRNIGLTETFTLQEVLNKWPLRERSMEVDANSHGILDVTREGEKDLLFVPTSPEYGSYTQVDVVDISGFIERDPEFLKEKLAEYHGFNGYASIVKKSALNLSRHAKLHNNDEFIPDFISRLPQSRDDYLKILTEYRMFLDAIWNTSGMEDVITAFAEKTQLGGIKTYLPHLKDCPGEPQWGQVKADRAITAAEILIGNMHIEHPSRPSFEIIPLMTYDYALHYASDLYLANEIRQEVTLTTNKNFTTFIRGTKTIKDSVMFDQKMAEQAPETHMLLNSFQSWLAVNKGEHTFQSISDTACLFMGGEEEPTYDKIQRVLQNVLKDVLGNTKTLPEEFKETRLDDTLILYCLTVLNAQVSGQDAAQFDPVIDEIASYHQRETTIAQNELMEHTSKRGSIMKFLDKWNIFKSDANDLKDLVKYTDESGNERYDHHLFTGALQARAGAAQSVMNITDASFAPFFTSLFPRANEEILSWIHAKKGKSSCR